MMSLESKVMRVQARKSSRFPLLAARATSLGAQTIWKKHSFFGNVAGSDEVLLVAS